jgi:hypothetical protein
MSGVFFALSFSTEGFLWRGSLLPLGGEAVVNPVYAVYLKS